ncbi:MAG: hypothetical protein ACIWVG_05255 [Gloeotrichia echinulata HAB0833]
MPQRVSLGLNPINLLCIMTDLEIQEKFYTLQNSDRTYACFEREQAQLGVLYYIRTSDSYNQGIEINCVKTARLLSKKGGIVHRQRVNCALKKLVDIGYLPESQEVMSNA